MLFQKLLLIFRLINLGKNENHELTYDLTLKLQIVSELQWDYKRSRNIHHKSFISLASKYKSRILYSLQVTSSHYRLPTKVPY